MSDPEHDFLQEDSGHTLHVGIWQAIPRLVVLCNRTIIGPSTLLYLFHLFAYEFTRSNVFYFALPLAVLPACCHCLVYFNIAEPKKRVYINFPTHMYIMGGSEQKITEVGVG